MSGSNTTGAGGKPEKEDIYAGISLAKIYKELGEAIESNTTKILEGMAEIDEQAMKIQRSFGYGRTSILQVKAAIADARDGVIALGGNIDNIITNQIEASTAIGRNVLLTGEAQEKLFAATKVTGQSVKDIVGSMKDVGISALDAADRMKTVIDQANQMGVSASAVSGKVLQNMSLLNQYNFQGGVEGLAKMAAQAISLRVDMNEIMRAADKAFNPEGAIKMAASLQRLGVEQSALLDPLQLMNMAENDPAELQNQIAEMSKQFVRLNKDGQFEILPGAKRRMREIEDALNLSRGTLSKMGIAGMELDEKLKRVKFPEFMTEEQKKTVANIAEMGKGGKVMIEYKGQNMELSDALKNVTNEEELNKLIDATKDKTIEELARDQLTFLDKINSGIAGLKGKVPTALSATEGGEASMNAYANMINKMAKKIDETTMGSTIDMAKRLDEPSKELAKQVKELTTGDGSVNAIIENLRKLSKSLSDFGKSIPPPRTVANVGAGASNVYEEISKVVTTLKATEEYQNLMTQAANLTNGLNNIIRTPDGIIMKDKTVVPLPQDEIAIGTKVFETLMKVMEMSKKAEPLITGNENFDYGEILMENLKKNFTEINPIKGIEQTPKVTYSQPNFDIKEISTQFSSAMEQLKTQRGGETLTTENKVSLEDSKLTIEVKAPNTVTQAQLEQIFSNIDFKQKIFEMLSKVPTNSNLLPARKQ